MILFIHACVRSDSRTRRLAGAVLEKLGGEYEELILEDVSFPVTDEEFLRRRDAVIAEERFDDPVCDLARQFAAADRIVIAAPYWDLSFPASLKQYVEHINVLGVTFIYTPEGTPKGLCKASDLYYVTTAGGAFCPEEFGFGYIKTLAESFYGIRNVKMISAYGLDIYGNDPEKILQDAIEAIDL